MKPKLLLFSILFVTAQFVMGQSLIYEDFTNTTFPPAGWTIDAHAANWGRVMTANAGAVAPELRLNWSPQFNAATHFISPSLNTSGYTSLTLSFYQYVDDYAGGYTIGVATRAGGGTWNNAWQLTVSGAVGPQFKVIEIATNDVGSSDFQICFFFSGDSYNLNFWYIDNIKLNVSVDRDAAMSKVNVPVYNEGVAPVKGTFINLGLNSITSADVVWQIDQGNLNLTSFNSLNVPFGNSYIFTCTQQLNLTPGIYDLKVWIENINGGGPDLDPTNDTVFQTIHVASQSVDRRPFFEEFTSSTCPPCATFNSTVFNPFLEQHDGEMTLVKYQMNWPAPGDPYFTLEGQTRRYFYGVSYVPDLYIDGLQTATTSAGVNNGFNASLAKASFMDISATHSIESNMVSGHVDVMSHVTGDLSIFVAIVEKITTGNVGSNGETEFHHVMMKMAPTDYGTPVSLIDCETASVDYSVDMSGTFVEEMSDLMVAVWVQDTVRKEVFQSAYSELQTGLPFMPSIAQIKAYPNPSDGVVFLSGITEINEVVVYNNVGNVVDKKTNLRSNRVDLGTLPNGLYILRIDSKEGIKTARVNIMR